MTPGGGEEGSSDPLLGNYGIFTGFGTCRPRRRFGRATVIAIVIWHPNERSVRVSPLNFFRSAPMGEGGGVVTSYTWKMDYYLTSDYPPPLQVSNVIIREHSEKMRGSSTTLFRAIRAPSGGGEAEPFKGCSAPTFPGLLLQKILSHESKIGPRHATLRSI